MHRQRVWFGPTRRYVIEISPGPNGRPGERVLAPDTTAGPTDPALWSTRDAVGPPSD